MQEELAAVVGDGFAAEVVHDVLRDLELDQVFLADGDALDVHLGETKEEWGDAGASPVSGSRWGVRRGSRAVGGGASRGRRAVVAVVVSIGKTARKISRLAVDVTGRVRALGAHLSASLGVEGVHRRALLLVQLRLAHEVEVGVRRRPSRDVSVSGGARSGAGGIRSFAATRHGGGATRRTRRRTTRDGVRFPVDVTRPVADIVRVVRARGVGVRRRKEACCRCTLRHPRWRSPEPPDLRDIFDPYCLPIRIHQNRRVFMNTFQSV